MPLICEKEILIYMVKNEKKLVFIIIGWVGNLFFLVFPDL